MSTLAWTLITILALLIGYLIIIYNGLISLKNKVKNAWADIDAQLKRRYDLIPNLVETVKGYASHEKSTFDDIVEARSKALHAEDVKAKESAENMLTQSLKSLFALAENYPDLKASANFTELQKALSEIEDKIQLSRRFYNATVRDFNTKIEIFPNNLIATRLGFTQKESFEALAGEKENVKVEF